MEEAINSTRKKRYAYGITIGKFLPFHKGHQYLIQQAAALSDRLVVIITQQDNYPLPLELRVGWIEETFSGPEFEHLTVLSLDQDLVQINDDDSVGWAEITQQIAGQPDVVFTSEDYGDEWARHLNCQHHPVDIPRENFPCHGRIIRENIHQFLDFLPPIVRRYFVKDVVIVGSESTGKSTLAENLAEHYKTSWIKEFGRFYYEALPDPKNYRWTSDDLLLIAERQTHFADQYAQTSSSQIAISDTNALTTNLFHKMFLGDFHPDLEYTFEKDDRLYIYCPVQFYKDDLTRDGEDFQIELDRLYRQVLTNKNVVYLEAGDQQSFLKQAIQAVDPLLAAIDLPYQPKIYS
jgi:NadR type nicotinamide-nucleotide adenylyltransferase